MIAIIDYSMGNLGSISNMLNYIGARSVITSDPIEIGLADKILLPGVGSFDKAMERIINLGLKEILEENSLIQQKPTLGICLGMQLLTRGSEEGILPGLGWIAADTKKFPQKDGLKIPHMGWNRVEVQNPSPLIDGLTEDSRFYFVHSYRVTVDNENHSLLRSFHGISFDAAIQKNNIFGAQFHPEKSHKFGMRLLRNFANI